MKREPTPRLRRHLYRGDRVFIPVDRMARIRWEESVLRGRLARDGAGDPAVTHGTCHCGSVECVGVPHAATAATHSFSSAPNGSLVITQAGVITAASVMVSHPSEGKFALRLTDPSGRTHRRVSAPDPSRYGSGTTRWVECAELVGAPLQGAWRLVVLDHACGEGELIRPWSLFASFHAPSAG